MRFTYQASFFVNHCRNYEEQVRRLCRIAGRRVFILPVHFKDAIFVIRFLFVESISMGWLFSLLAGLVLGVALLWIFWRYLSRTTSAPCPTWLSWMLEVNLGGKPAGRGRAVEQLALEPGMRVADVGCGPGRLTLPIAEAVGPSGEVLALDMQQGMLDKMARRIASAGLSNVTPICGGAGDGHLPEGRFDRAILSTVLGEIPDRERAMREIAKALKPGGFLLVVEVLGDPHYQFKSKVVALADLAGLQAGDYYPGWWSYALRLYRAE